MAGEENTTAAVKFTTDAGEVAYELKPGEQTALDASDFAKVAEYATANKLTLEQATAIVAHREEAATGYRTRSEAALKAPDKYELKLGEKSALDQSDLDKIAEVAKANKLTQAQAEVLVQQREEAAAGLVARQQTFLDNTVKKWADDVKNDPEIGGDHLTVTLKNAKRVMDRFAPEGSKFATLLKESGYGSHPEFVRFINSVGKAMSEDGPIGGGGQNKGAETLADKMYPSMKQTA